MMIKAIETEYNGYRFRSRLEARWAVFFDAAGIEYQYEPEGYDLGDGIWYLPDFWLPADRHPAHPGAGYFLEIKPIEPSNKEIEKIRRLSIGTKHSSYLFYGPPGVKANGFIKTGKSGGVYEQKIGMPEDVQDMWGGLLGIQLQSNRNEKLPCLYAATTKAKSARFGR